MITSLNFAPDLAAISVLVDDLGRRRRSRPAAAQLVRDVAQEPLFQRSFVRRVDRLQLRGALLTLISSSFEFPQLRASRFSHGSTLPPFFAMTSCRCRSDRAAHHLELTSEEADLVARVHGADLAIEVAGHDRGGVVGECRVMGANMRRLSTTENAMPISVTSRRT
jgi:hypothetical protein